MTATGAHVASTSEGGNAAWLLWRAAEQAAGATAIVDGDRTVTYAELALRAGDHAAALTAHGVRAGDRVVVLGKRSWDTASAIFGALATGAIVVIVADALRRRQITHILDMSEPAVAIVGSDVAGPLDRSSGTPIPVVRPVTRGCDVRPAARDGMDPAQMIFTSGSCGRPKGVLVSHENLWSGVAAVGAYLGLRSDDRLAALLPFSFDYGLSQLLLAVASRGALVVERSPLAQRIDATLRAQEVTIAAGVPWTWQGLLRVPRFRREPIESLRTITSTGGRLPVATVRALRAAQPQARLFSMYGLTEAFRSTYLPPTEIDRKPSSVGRAIPEATVVVVRPDGTPCAPFEVGEIVHRGPTVALGYWRDGVATERVFRPDPKASDQRRMVMTGDLGYIDVEGDLYVVGRRDGVFKRYGYRVSRDELAEALHESGLVATACVVVGPSDADDPAVTAHVVLAPGASRAGLARYIASELPRHLAPTDIREVPALPVNAHGKPDVSALVEG